LDCDVTFGAFTLLRHAMPQQVPDEDPSTWRLGPEGVAAARKLSGLLSENPYVVASAEPKASATALLVTGRDPALDLRLVEARRPSRWNSEHRSDARRYLSGEDVHGWEAQSDVLRRIGESLDDHQSRAGSRQLVVVGHGISTSLWIAATLGIDAVRWWKSLRFPDAWEIDLLALRANRIHASL
jgi:broad specificity phosphatase PhoE